MKTIHALVSVSACALAFGACSSPRGGDLKPELAKSDGYFVSGPESDARGGVGNYVDRHAGQQKVSSTESDTVQTSSASASTPSSAVKGGSSSVYYPMNSADIPEKERSRLNSLASDALKDPSLSITVEGRADALGPDNANLNLSQRRASNVQRYLQSRGVPNDQIEVKGIGEEEADQSKSKTGNPPDRRVIVTTSSG